MNVDDETRRERERERSARYRATHQEELKERKKKYYIANREECIKKAVIQSKRYKTLAHYKAKQREYNKCGTQNLTYAYISRLLQDTKVHIKGPPLQYPEELIEQKREQIKIHRLILQFKQEVSK